MLETSDQAVNKSGTSHPDTGLDLFALRPICKTKLLRYHYDSFVHANLAKKRYKTEKYRRV